ncbi:MAG: hypothetical protein MUF21_00080 [Gemmatimonadaceae bacterium]|mgnify:FL=1|nr:hypothetical protein [Gemmatimonadaceae bacterium]
MWLAGRDTGHLPRRLLGRDLFQWTWPLMTRATVDTTLGRRLRARARRQGDALIGIPERALREAGVVRVGRVEAAQGGLPVAGAGAGRAGGPGDVLRPAAVVWCTGFRPDFGWIDLPVLDAWGLPRHRRGVAADVHGLYFVGLRFQHRMTSALLGGVGADAAFVAQQVAERAAARAGAAPGPPAGARARVIAA